MTKNNIIGESDLKIIGFNITVVGWYNFSFAMFKYNIDPETFRNITGISEQAALGTCEVTMEELEALRKDATYIGLADGWEWVSSDDEVS